MKYFIIFIYSLFAMVFPSTGQTPPTSVPTYVEAANVALPDIPLTLDFAGEAVPLDNFDTRESLRRELLTTGYMHARTWQTLLNTKRYFDIIEPILEKNGIPLDFKYLCMAESGLNPEAVSSAKAGGLWQIMPATGKEYGLYADTEVDERFHIEKSTEAACRILKDSYNRFGSWTLAAAAYNIGSGGLNRRLEKQGVSDYYDVYLPQETLRYVFRILSFKVITENPAAYGFHIHSGDYNQPHTDYRELIVNQKNIDWSKLARENGTTYKMLRELNPWIRDYEFKNTAGRTFTVKIPGDGFRESSHR